MSRYLNNPGEVPPKAWPEQKEQGFAYKHLETGTLIVAPSWKDLVARVQRFHIANTFPIGANFEQGIMDQLCGQLPAICTDNDPNRTAEVPRPNWPLWAKAMALVAVEGEAGVGSTVERIIGPFGGEAFKKFYEATFHKSCGCTERAEAWDVQYPYK